MTNDTHHWVEVVQLESTDVLALACSRCAVCTCHDDENKADEPCEPTGFFMVPTSYPRQGSTGTYPPEIPELKKMK